MEIAPHNMAGRKAICAHAEWKTWWGATRRRPLTPGKEYTVVSSQWDPPEHLYVVRDDEGCLTAHPTTCFAQSVEEWREMQLYQLGID